MHAAASAAAAGIGLGAAIARPGGAFVLIQKMNDGIQRADCR